MAGRSLGPGGGEKDRLLFDLSGMDTSPPWPSRLKRLAALPPPPRSARELRAIEDRRTIDRLREIAAVLARRFRLTCLALEAERDGVYEHYGICYRDGRIRVRLRHKSTGRLLKESSLVDTLCHELAHLRHFDHSPRFKRFYLSILEEARRRGWYRPGPEPSVGEQRALFRDWDCGIAIARKSPGKGAHG